MEKALKAIDIEETVLGAIILEPHVFITLQSEWTESIFDKPAHRDIAWAIKCLAQRNEPIDMMTVVNALKSGDRLESAGGAYYIAQLTQRVASSANTEYHFKILRQYKMLRDLQGIGLSIQSEVHDQMADPFEIIFRNEKRLTSLLNGLASMQVSHVADINKRAIERIENIKSGKMETGIWTGFKRLQNHTGGWQNSDLIILAARPAMGKTSLALKFLLEPAIKSRTPVLMFSLEMSALQLMTRIQAIYANYSATNLIRANIDTYDLDSLKLTMQGITSLPIYIDDTPAISIPEFKAKARRMKSEQNVGLIIVDYLQLMRSGLNINNREQEISYISRELKATAKELNIPIMALSQLSRDVEKRATKSKIPQLSDLRDSGAIEQDADVVMFIYRPEYYGLDEFEDGTPAKDMAEIILAKNRQGAVASTQVGFEGHRTRFFDSEEETTMTALQPNEEF